jgi:hypothetical protein
MKIRSLEKRMAAILFVLVLVVFSMANEDTRKLKQFYSGINGQTGRIFKQELFRQSSHLARAVPNIK